MKFEIDDKTGMVNVEQEYIIDEDMGSELKPRIPFLTELEAILQAVKKTQEKLVNRQIQNIQDSKKEYVTHQLHETKKLYKQQKDKIEQNQKIVDEIDECFGDDIHNQPALIQHRATAFFEKYGKRLQ